MRIKFETWDESILDIEDYEAERALQKAALDALHRARRYGTDFVIREKGQVKSLRPDETAACEKEMLTNLERLNQKIAELGRQTSGSFALNDSPKS